MKNASRKKPFWNSPPAKKVTLVILTLILTLAALELMLRMIGFAIVNLQEYRNRQAIKQRGNFRVICLGESTTQNQYPRYLEKILNKNNPGVKTSVVDCGQSGATTTTLLLHLQDTLDKYKPDVVVTMMGCNDYRTLYYLDIPEANTGLFKNCRLYRFARIIYMDISNKLNKRDIYRPSAHKNTAAQEKYPDISKIKMTQLEKEYKKLAEFSDLTKITNRGYGLRYKDLKRVAELEKIWEKIIEINPRDAYAYSKLAILYWDAGKFNEAENALIKALKIEPGNYMTYVQLGRVYRDHGKFVKSEEIYKEAAQINPNKYEAYAGLEWLYRHQKRFEERLQILKKVTELTPKVEHDYLNAGLFFSYLGEFAESEEAYSKCLELNPRNNRAYAGLGYVYEKERKFNKSEDAYRKAIELDPDNDPAYMELYWTYREQNKSAKAEEILKKAIAHNPRNDLALGGLAVKYLETGETELAENYSAQANTLRREFYNSVTARNYHKLKEILDTRKIRLVCAQYPMRSITVLKKLLKDEPEGDIIFVDNEKIFKDAVRTDGYDAYFTDMFGGDFGHCTEKGNRLLAENIANAILKNVFEK
ncbi:MAG: tetratricopeptide repeat protein [Candidatus Omnitrophica bacterium]|nr:tetratricopeptide repeat protein [Candidatus Omnitrophota bacterium]